MLKAFRRAAQSRRIAVDLESRIAGRSRAPVFYAGLGVPDTIDGRFDLLTLHAALVLEKLAADGYDALSQALIDRIFVSFDESLRDLGAGDIGMSRRMKQMAGAFFGRLKVYRGARSAEALAEAIQRNIYRSDAAVTSSARLLARYVTAARAALEASDVAAGDVDFGPLPTPEQ